MNVLVLNPTNNFISFGRTEINLIHLKPEFTSDQKWTIDGKRVFYNDMELHGFLYLSKLNESFSKSFTIEDQSFCDIEIKALLLDIINKEEIFSLNRYTSDAWFRGESWSYWRTILLQEGFTVSDLSFCTEEILNAQSTYVNFNTCHQYNISDSISNQHINFGITQDKFSKRVTFLYDTIIEGSPNNKQLQVIEFLKSKGLNYAALIVDSNDLIFSVNPSPDLNDNDVILEFDRTILNEIEIFRTYRGY